MNVTARHGQGAVHLGGHEMANGRWSPACGTQHHNVGDRTPTPLRPTEDAVTCKRCLKLIAKLDAEKAQAEAASVPQQTNPEPTATHADAVAQMRANIDAEEEARAAARRARNRTNYAPAPEVAETTVRTERKTRTFTFEYNATEGVLIAAALREKALDERKAAQAYRTNAEIEGTTLVEFYTEQARLADNRAKLFEDAADQVHKPVREAISTAVANAIPDEPEPAFHRQVKDAIGLRW